MLAQELRIFQDLKTLGERVPIMSCLVCDMERDRQMLAGKIPWVGTFSKYSFRLAWNPGSLSRLTPQLQLHSKKFYFLLTFEYQ